MDGVNMSNISSFPTAQRQSIIARQGRAGVRRGVRSGSISLAAGLRSPVALIGDMATYELLLCVPKMGLGRLAILNQSAMAARVNLCLPVVVLTERQRLWIERACDSIVRTNEVEAVIDELCRN